MSDLLEPGSHGPAPLEPAPPGALRADPSALATIFGFRTRVSRRLYFATGLALMLVKYALELLIFALWTDTLLTPFAFLTPFYFHRAELLQGAPSFVTWVLIGASLPFLVVGMSMSVRRSLDAGLSPLLGVLFLVPGMHYVVMATLSFVPTGWGQQLTAMAQARADAVRPKLPSPVLTPPLDEPAKGYREAGQKIAADDEDALPSKEGVPRPVRDLTKRTPPPQAAIPTHQTPTTGAPAAVFVLCSIVGLGMFFFSVNVLGLYGASLFFGTPFAMAFIGAVMVTGRREAAGCVTAAFLCVAGVLLLLALEGAICILMAAVPAAIVGLVGFALGRSAKQMSLSQGSSPRMLVGVLLLPAVASFEKVTQAPPIHSVTTSVIVDAPPDVVWEHVVAFSPLEEPDEPLFRAGVAYPKSAHIDGAGVGAIRYCNFSTGSFVEPITVWEPGRLLAFDVEQSPKPMRELSFYETVDAPHLDGFMQSRRGQFKLERLPDGRTLLEGTTEYQLEIYPELYWKAWTDGIIHTIHRRVLDHVRLESERDHEERLR